MPAFALYAGLIGGATVASGVTSKLDQIKETIRRIYREWKYHDHYFHCGVNPRGCAVMLKYLFGQMHQFKPNQSFQHFTRDIGGEEYNYVLPMSGKQFSIRTKYGKICFTLYIASDKVHTVRVSIVKRRWGFKRRSSADILNYFITDLLNKEGIKSFGQHANLRQPPIVDNDTSVTERQLPHKLFLREKEMERQAKSKKQTGVEQFDQVWKQHQQAQQRAQMQSNVQKQPNVQTQPVPQREYRSPPKWEQVDTPPATTNTAFKLSSIRGQNLRQRKGTNGGNGEVNQPLLSNDETSA